MKKMVYPDFKKKVVMVTTGDDRNANIIMTPTSIQTECWKKRKTKFVLILVYNKFQGHLTLVNLFPDFSLARYYTCKWRTKWIGPVQ